MTSRRIDLADEETALAAGRAAGYCWVHAGRAPGRCTRPLGHTGDHVDYYNGRATPEATEGYRWPQ